MVLFLFSSTPNLQIRILSFYSKKTLTSKVGDELRLLPT